ncbi:CapA family protein [Shewanella algae]|uniref:CapA family protein n=1 Tax=Shewanella algae TaxID=38313 RepID=UPI001AAC9DED|nr:CapA family protein [Shewanella algae]MBO2560426.1 CapA family protein [Shewanella algae]MBO2619739.1 CapA family protein [Shewanella algae]
MELKATVVIGGDFSPVNRNEKPLVEGELNKVFNDLMPILNDSDFNVFNLESPVLDELSPMEKFGPKLKSSSKVLNYLGNGFIDCVGLANNHIMDYDEAGLKSTIKACRENNILFFGAGKNLNAAKEVKKVTINGVTVGFLGIAEQEFSIATSNSYGANPLDVIDNYETIKNRCDCDFLIVLFHTGNEQYEYPSPRLKKTCHFLLNAGADLVVCQHSHCVGSYEQVGDKHIVYGQGNMLFDFHNNLKGWNEGMLIKLDFIASGKVELNFIPIYQTPGEIGVRLMPENRSKEFLENFFERSKLVYDNEALQKKWDDYCESVSRRYLSDLLFPYNRYGSWFIRKFLLIDKIINNRAKALLVNMFRCEIHREVVVNILRRK